MIEILFVACSIVGKCQTDKLTFAAVPGELSQFTCAKYGQYHLSKWAGEHPGLYIKRWKCRPAGMYAKA